MKFLCDEMLAGLARWLRAAGYDAAMARPGAADRDLVAQARAEGRILLTLDRALPAIKGAADISVLLHGAGLDAWAGELKARLGVDWLARPFTRCLMCNVELATADAQALARMPEDSRNGAGPFRACPRCRRGYWPGSHVKRMQRRLAAFAGQRPDDAP